MKKAILSLIVICASISANATHLLGGALYATCIDDPNTSDYEYLVTLVLLRDVTGVAMSNSQVMNLYSSSQPSVIFNIEQVNSFSFSGPRPYEIYVFMDTISVTQGDIYTIACQLCCRPPNILNINGGQSVNSSYFLEVMVNTQFGCNSTPVFVAPFSLTWPKGPNWATSYSAFDLDGDSMSYRLDTCRASWTLPVNNYVYPFTSPGSTPTLDPNSGLYTMAADSVGSYNIRVTTEAFGANGQMTSSISGDFHIEVIDVGNGNLISLTPPSDVVDGTRTWRVGAPDTLEISATTDVPSMNVEYYVPEMVDKNDIYFSFNHQGNNVDVDFSWNPTIQDIDTEFPVVVRFKGPDVNYDYSFIMVAVDGNISVRELTPTNIIAYPNPATNRMTVQFDQPMKRIQLINPAGQLMIDEEVDPNAKHVEVNQFAGPGMYVIRMITVEGEVLTQPVIVQ